MSDIRKKIAEKSSKLSKPNKKLTERPTDIVNYQDGSYVVVELADIKPDPNQPRKHFNQERLEELSASIKQKGVIQPVLIRFDENKTIFLIAGERRYRAAKLAGLKQIPAIVKTDEKPNEIALIENIQREDLNPIEEAEALNQMMIEYNYTQEELAKVIGKSRTNIVRSLSLNKLPDEIKKECRENNNISKRTLTEIASAKSPKAMLDLFNQVKSNELKSDQIRQRKKPSERVSRKKAAIVLEKVQMFSKSIQNLNLDIFENEDKIKIIEELSSLEKLIKSKFD